MNIRDLINKIDDIQLERSNTVIDNDTGEIIDTDHAVAHPTTNVTQPSTALTSPASAVAGKEAGVMSKMWGGIKGFFGKAALPIAIAAEIWDGWESIQAIPVDTPETEYRAQVTKIVTNLVANFGLFWVGSIIGGAIAGAVTGGTGALAGFIGGGVGGMAASYFLGEKGIDQLINAIVDHVYDSKAHAAKDGKGPNGEPLVKNPRTGQMGYWKKNGRTTDFVTVDPSTLPKVSAQAKGIGARDSNQWSGENIGQIQQGLKDLGFDPGAIDSKFGPNTAAAVRKFQQANGLKVDGDPGPDTVAAINKQLATKKAAPAESHLAEDIIRSFGY